MKRLSLILSLAVLMALAVAAAAVAATISASGNLGYRMAYATFDDSDEKYELRSQWRYYTNLYFRGSKGPVSANVRYYLRSYSVWTDNDSGKAPTNGTDGWVDTRQRTRLAGLDTVAGDMLEAYLDFKGAIIPGLPEGTLRIGRFSTNQNNWIGNFSRRDAIMLSGVKVGPANLVLYHGWRTKDNDKNRVTAVKATGKVDIVDLTAVYVAQSVYGNEDASRADFMVGASASPIKDLKVSVEVASNGTPKSSNDDARLGWKVNGELSSIPNLKLRASTWSTDPAFDATYKHNTNRESLLWDYANSSRPTAFGDPWIQQGFSVGVTTTQAGLPFDVDIKTGKLFDGTTGASSGVPSALRGENMMVVNVGTTVAQVKTDVAVTMIGENDPVIDVLTTRALDVGFLGGKVNLRGNVRMQGDEDTQFGADATWNAPNGLVLGVHYANYDRGTDWNHNRSSANLSEGFNIGKAGEADGFAITAGYLLSF